MAYTYDDFIKAGNASGRMGRFSEADLAVTKTNPEYGLSMLQLLKDEDEATSADAKLMATSAMEQLRKNYGVEAPGVSSSFHYVKENDPNYQAFRKAYLREGERATGDTLAKAAATTGGVPSSYAATAAAQAGNYYASQLADKVPELREIARQQHENDAAKYLQSIALKIEGQQAQDQQKVDNAWKTYNATGYATPEIATILGVQEGWAPSILQEQDQQKIENAWQLYGALGYATPEIAAILGVPEGVAPSVQQEQRQQQIDNAWKLYEKLGYVTPEIAETLGVPYEDLVGGVLVGGGQTTFDDLKAIINSKGAKYQELIELLNTTIAERGITVDEYNDLMELTKKVYGVVGTKWEELNGRYERT